MIRIHNDWAMLMPRRFAVATVLGPYRMYFTPCAKLLKWVTTACPHSRVCDDKEIMKGWNSRQGGLFQPELGTPH
jgi:hypothetical protein